MDDTLYQEKVTSRRTTALFVALALLFLLLAAWRAAVSGLSALPIVLFCLSGFFMFYTVNYRVLIARCLAREAVRGT